MKKKSSTGLALELVIVKLETQTGNKVKIVQCEGRGQAWAQVEVWEAVQLAATTLVGQRQVCGALELVGLGVVGQLFGGSMWLAR